MKNITVIRLRLENFKCHRSLEIFLDGCNAAIYGDNASGKTSVYDALTWLLFGKDSAGNGEKNFDVKPLDASGAVADHNAITSVEAVLQVGVDAVTLKRTYREVWSTKRGSSEESFDGNMSEYFIDGVPCKKTAFDGRIREILSEETFRLLTSVSYFAQDLHWTKRRAVLFDIAGTLSDREIMATDGRFSELSQALGKLTIEDYRRKLQADKKNYSGIKTDIPARISECEKTISILEDIDFAAVEAENMALQSEADRVAGQIREANQCSTQQQRAELVHLDKQISRGREQLLTCEKTAADQESRINDSRGRWIATNQESFTGGLCPTCGQKLPPEQLQAATARFEATKRSRLHEIEQTAASQKAAKEQAEQRAEQMREELRQMEGQAAAIRASLPAADYQQDDGLQSRLSEIRRQISENWKRLGNREVLEHSRQRIEELQKEARHAAELLETLDSMLYMVDEFTRYKTCFVEESINRQFQSATFRLFREQANGGIEERCDVVFDGIPYSGLNNGAKINVGIDIINTLARYYGVSVPLFVDNAESVTRLEDAAAQVIRLVVSESDKELRCEYED